MAHFSYLPMIIGLPFLGAFCIFCIRGSERVTSVNSKNLALWVSSVTFFLTLFVFFKFDFNSDKLQFAYESSGVESLMLSWELGVNALSLPFMVLTAFFALSAVLVTPKRLPMMKVFMIMILMIEGFLLGTVCSRNLFQFFLFHEGTFIPLFMLSSLWNEKNKEQYPFKQYGTFFLSFVLFFFGILYLHSQTGSLNLDSLADTPFPPRVQEILLFVFLPAFMINVPLAPFHSWFLKSQADMPVPCMLILSGAVSKLALYGTIAVLVSLSPDVMRSYMFWLMLWAACSAVYAAVSLFFCQDVKEKMVYMQMSLFSIAACAVFSLNAEAVFAVLLFCLTQSFSLAAFIIVLSFLFERTQSTDMERFKGLGAEIPAFCTAFFVVSCCFAVLPATPAFTPLFLMIQKIFSVGVSFGVAALICVVCVFAAIANLYAGTVFGERQQTFSPYADLKKREKAQFFILSGLLFFSTVFLQAFELPCVAGTRVISAFISAS